MNFTIPFLTLITSALLGLYITPKILAYCRKNSFYDRIDERKIHGTNIPRLGGVAFLPSMLISFLIALVLYNFTNSSVHINLWSLGVMLGLVIVYTVGLIDDYAELPPLLKLFIQFIAASLLPLCGLYLNNLYGLFGIYEISPWVGIPITIYLIMFVNNSINLIDGIDGLAASICVITLAVFMGIFLLEDMTIYASLVAGLIGVLLSYLRFNLFGNAEKGKKIFMGDSGSLLLGYVISFLSLKHAVNNPIVMTYRDYALLLPLTLILIPTFDAVRVIIVRFANKQSPTTPDKRHIHHKLLAAGLNQHQALAVILIAQLCFIGLNYALYITEVNCNVILLIDVIVYTLANLLLDALKAENQ